MISNFIEKWQLALIPMFLSVLFFSWAVPLGVAAYKTRSWKRVVFIIFCLACICMSGFCILIIWAWPSPQ